MRTLLVAGICCDIGHLGSFAIRGKCPLQGIHLDFAHGNSNRGMDQHLIGHLFRAVHPASWIAPSSSRPKAVECDL
jgi:hypothetical protein